MIQSPKGKTAEEGEFMNTWLLQLKREIHSEYVTTAQWYVLDKKLKCIINNSLI